MAFSGTVAIRAMKDGDYQATIFPGTAVGLQAALDYAGLLGIVDVGPGTISGVTNLTMYGKCMLRGAGPLATLLVRDAAATGITLREKTGAEGNASGATGIVVRDLSIYANGSAGDGINFGNQGGAAFNANAYLSDVLVRDFASGIGVKLLADAIQIRDVWSVANATGFYLAGGANHFNGLWAEENSTTQLTGTIERSTFNHVQMEQSGVVPATMIDLLAGANQNRFFGIYMSLSGTSANLIVNRTNSINCSYFGVTVKDNGQTYTNTIYDEAQTTGTGNAAYIPMYTDGGYSMSCFFYDTTTGGFSKITGADFQPSQFHATGDIVVGTAGTSAQATTGQGTTGADYGTVRARSGTGGIAQFLLNQNNVDLAGLRVSSGATFLDCYGDLYWRQGLSGTLMAKLTTAGALSTVSTMTVGNLTSGKYPKISTAGLLIDGPTPLAGTKVYYVSDTSGGAVTRKLTFTDGILTAET